MRTDPFGDTDVTESVRQISNSRRRVRRLALIGLAVFISIVGLALGSLAVQGGFGRTAGIVALSAWGCWAINWLFKRA